METQLGIKIGTGKAKKMLFFSISVSMIYVYHAYLSFTTFYYHYVSPYYRASHIKLRKEIREFIDKEVMPFCHEWSEAKAIPREVLKRAAEIGLLNAMCGAGKNPKNAAYMKYPLPAGLKPEEFDIFHEFVCVDEVARCGSGGFIWALSGGLGIGLPPVMNFGSEEMKQKVVPGCLAGEKIIALAITEPSGGSDVANLRTTAKDMGDHYVVNGEKKWITQGAYADYYTVACRTGGEGMGGVSLLLIERNMPGVVSIQFENPSRKDRFGY